MYVFAQCSQLFPSPSEYCCANFQILTYSATAFEEYPRPPHTRTHPHSHPPHLLTIGTKLFLQVWALETTYSNQSWIGPCMKVFTANKLKAPIITFNPSPISPLAENATKTKHKVEALQAQTSEIRGTEMTKGSKTPGPKPASFSVPLSHDGSV